MGQEQHHRVYNHPLKDSKQPGFSHVYRSERTLDGLLSTPEPNLHSMKDVILQSAKKFGGKDFMGNIVIEKEEGNG